MSLKKPICVANRKVSQLLLQLPIVQQSLSLICTLVTCRMRVSLSVRTLPPSQEGAFTWPAAFRLSTPHTLTTSDGGGGSVSQRGRPDCPAFRIPSAFQNVLK